MTPPPEDITAECALPGHRSRRREVTSDRICQLIEFDKDISKHHGGLTVVGIDEVGRGCLAGPVVAAAVILPVIDVGSELMNQLLTLNDSKQVKPEQRAILSSRLQLMCRFSIGEATVEEIDKVNILQASLIAMRRAVRKLKLTEPAVLTVDGNKKIPAIRMKQTTVIDGDTKSASIAAASIIAKVYRDNFMVRLSEKFPAYKWESNKGYRSREHWKAIDEKGTTRWHRRSFVDHWLAAEKTHDLQ